MSLALLFVALCLLPVDVFSNPLGNSLFKRQDATPTTSTNGPQSTDCGELVVAAANGYNVFYAEDAYECLKSIPFNAAVATRFIKYWNDTLQFQSTLAFLKDPPDGYQQPPLDVMQVLQEIENNVTAGLYMNEYNFEADIQMLINRMHDAHVSLNAGVLQPFSFVSPHSIVSASVDGKSIPEIFFSEHVIRCQRLGCQPSPITHINGVEVINYLTWYAVLNSAGYLEPHTDWNSLMDSPTRKILGGLGLFQAGTFYPKHHLNFTFKKGDPINTYWFSIFKEHEETGPLTTGGDFYNYFVLGLLPASYKKGWKWYPILPPEKNSSDTNNTEYPPAHCTGENNWCKESDGAYPDNPVISQNNLSIVEGGIVTGYLLHDISTGVLSIPTFDQYSFNTDNFQDAIQSFIDNMTARNTSRIIIDLQQNQGGAVYLAINTFKQFFYTRDPHVASRIRNHELATILGEAYSQWWEGLEADLKGNGGGNEHNYAHYAASEWVATNRINPATGRNFSSWAEYAGPLTDRGDMFSLPQRYNLSDQVFDAAAFSNWIPLGYGGAEHPENHPERWAPEDIVILTDGACSSSCALFVEMMTHQAGVRTIVVGGRPVTGPMQAVAGSRGAQVYSADAIDQDFHDLKDRVNNQTAYALLPNRSDTGIWITYAGFNIKDQLRDGDDVPLQFKYEAADCRIWYTLANVYNLTQLWYDVASAAWSDPSVCVEGSTGFPTGRNTTAAKPPPERTAQTPHLTFDSEQVNLVNFNETPMVGLIDAQTFRDSGEIVPCDRNYNCKGVSICNQNVKIVCHASTTLNPSYSTVSLCFPPCQIQSGKDPCKGWGNFCDPDVPAQSKMNVWSDDRKGGLTFQNQVQNGHCKPSTNVGTSRMCSGK